MCNVIVTPESSFNATSSLEIISSSRNICLYRSRLDFEATIATLTQELLLRFMKHLSTRARPDTSAEHRVQLLDALFTDYSQNELTQEQIVHLMTLPSLNRFPGRYPLQQTV